MGVERTLAPKQHHPEGFGGYWTQRIVEGITKPGPADSVQMAVLPQKGQAIDREIVLRLGKGTPN